MADEKNTMAESLPAAFKPFLQPPPLHESGEELFWNDPHISKGMLKAHLDPDTDAASRKPQFLERSARWITEIAGLEPGASILDLGCGPGLYAAHWAREGFSVTGIDMSERSIAWAREEAARLNLNISYRNANYIEAEINGSFDLVTMIYCDFGVLGSRDQIRLLERIRSVLSSGAHFIFDVLATPRLSSLNLEPRYSMHDSGFWSPGPHEVLSQTWSFPEENVLLDQDVVIEEGGPPRIYRRWEHVYDEDRITTLLSGTGFKATAFYSDLTGAAPDRQSEFIGVIATSRP